MTDAPLRRNPYVGLRPFFEDDSLYFFGRGPQVAELLRILHEHRFLGIVGSSGSGKSSLVRAGLVPKLLGGFLTGARTRWSIVRTRPGDAPMANLAAALVEGFGLPARDRDALEPRLRDAPADAVLDLATAHLGDDTNLLVLVDQFEEIFAFRGGVDPPAGQTDAARWNTWAHRRAEAADFVDLLLQLSSRRELPIYVAIAMRTDFLGECDLFYGLPEALNRGRYLVPRLIRQQLREAIEGPALLLRARLEPRLLDHLLNELGDRFDRLPVLQHALLRTWDEWQRAGGVGPIDFPHYDAAGGLDLALDKDAESALATTDPAIAAAVFRRLTDTDTQQRRVRSPARVSQLSAAAAVDPATIQAVLRRFAEGGRSFVHALADGRPDDPRVDISHESLIRQWNRLRGWVDEERASRDRYRELVGRARKHERGEAGLLQGPELRILVDWRDRARPSAAWAERYTEATGDFEGAVTYLDASLAGHCATIAESELQRRWKIWNPILLLAVLAGALLVEQSSGPPADAPFSETASAGIEREGAAAAAPLRTVRIDDAEWIADDRGRPLDWQSAFDHCDGLRLGGRHGWRLPTTGELLEIHDPATPTAAGLALKAPFHEGVGSALIWSDEEGERVDEAMAADFRAGLFVSLPLKPGLDVRALCVLPPTPAGRAEDLASKRRGLVETLAAYWPVGVVVLLYLGLAWAGRKLHRRLAYPRILRSVRASGGRTPDEVESRAAGQEAVEVHGTSYASTGRRLAGYAIDTALYLTLVFVMFVILVVVQPVPVVVTMPSGERIEGTLDSDVTDDGPVSFVSADGRRHTFPIGGGPRLAVVGGMPVETTLPNGTRATGRSFERLQVVVTQPSGEQIEGTLERSDDRSVTVSVADGTLRTVAMDPNLPEVDVQWPPSDAGLGWFFAWCLVVGWLYETVQVTSLKQATLGMRAVGIFRTDLQGRRLSLSRASAWYGYRLLSYAAYLLGFVSQPFTTRRQTFHDWMAGSVVLRRPRA